MAPQPSHTPRRSRARDRDNARSPFLVYVGTYNEAEQRGIHAFRFDSVTGQLSALGLGSAAVHPTFVLSDLQGRFLYATKEVEQHEGKSSGAVRSYAIDRKTGKLRFLNEVPSNGDLPCYVALDRRGQYAMVANYGSGSVEVIRVRKDGRLGQITAFDQHSGSGINPERQEGPHAHWINVSPDNRYVISTDLGVDKVFVYRFDEQKGTIKPDDPPFAAVEPGSGPRHIAFAPNGRFVYLINELKSTITVFAYEAARGALHSLQTISTLPKNYKGENTCAEIAVSPSGRFVYGSNRGHDSIAVFVADPKKGTLTPVERVSSYGKTPRHFAIDPTGSYLVAGNQDSDSLIVFRIDRKTGRLTPTGQMLQVFSPSCVRFVTFR